MSTVRVFVCSAYRDMQAERQYLHEVIFPRVQGRCQENGITFEVVDPRHTAQSEEQAEGIDALDQALNDVDSCRPYFIGLLGQNYSRIYIEIPHEVGLRHESVRHFFRCSRTHLETLYGALKSPDAKAFFYARKPDVLEQIPPTDRITYDPDTEIARHKLFMMKRAIGAGNFPLREYDAQWDDMQKKLVGLEAFGEMVAADLLSMAGISEAPAAMAMDAVSPMDTGEVVPMDTGEVLTMDAEDMVAMEAVEEVPMEEVAPIEEAAMPFEAATSEPFGETAGEEPIQMFEEAPAEEVQMFEEAAPAEEIQAFEEAPAEEIPAFEEAPAEEPIQMFEEAAEEQPFDLGGGGDDIQIMEEASEEVSLSDAPEVQDEDIDLASIFDDDKNK